MYLYRSVMTQVMTLKHWYSYLFKVPWTLNAKSPVYGFAGMAEAEYAPDAMGPQHSLAPAGDR